MLQNNSTINLLLVDDNPNDIVLIKSLLETVPGVTYAVKDFSSRADAVDFLKGSQNSDIDVCLIDYSIGMDTAVDFIDDVGKTKDIQPPIVVMTGQPNDETDRQLMELGVQDYWDKGSLSGETLERSLRYAIHQHHSYQNKSRESEKKTRHLAQISHDLKNPLGSIQSFANIAEKIIESVDLPSSDRQKVDSCFENIAKSAIYMHHLVEELLNLSEIESGNTQLKREQCNLSELLLELYESFSPLAEAHDLKLEINCEDDLMIFADEHRLRQIISNLISNAIKYTDEGAVLLKARQEASTDENIIIIDVIDTGIGIESSQHENIFSEYTRVHKTLKKSVESTGLGLSIVKQLVELHNGTIHVNSTLNEGSTFTVRLPQRNEAASRKHD